MSDEEPKTQFKFMLPVEVKARLEEAAQLNRRSLSAEIIDRLSFSIENPPSAVQAIKREWAAADSDLTTMETDLRFQAEEMRKLVKANKALQQKNKETVEHVISMMYHVLNYMDDIPEELAIWAYDIIRGSRNQQLFTDEISEYDIPAPDVQAIIKQERARYRALAMDMIKQEIELPFPDIENSTES